MLFNLLIDWLVFSWESRVMDGREALGHSVPRDFTSGCRRDRKGAGPSVLGIAVLHPLFYCWDTPTPSQLHPSPFPAPSQPLPIPIPAWSGILKLGMVLLSLPLLPKISWAVNHSNISFIALKLSGRKPNACLNAWEFSGRQHFPWIPLCLCKEGAWAVLEAPAQIKQENGILIPPARRASLNSSFVKHSQPFFFYSCHLSPPVLPLPLPSLPRNYWWQFCKWSCAVSS